jgi:hypothetical protein
MAEHNTVERLKKQLEALGCKAQICGHCGALLTTRMLGEEEAISKLIKSKNLKGNDLFCLCD